MRTPAHLAISALAALLLATGCGGSASAPPAPASSGPAAPASAAPASAAAKPSAASASAKPAASAAASAKPAASGGASASAKPEGTGQYSGGDPNGTPLRISFASPAVSDSPYYAALSQGFWAQQHLKVTMFMMPPNVAVPALSKGDIDMVDAPSNAIEGATRGLPFKVIFSAWQRSPWVLVGKQQYNSINDLKGKLVGTNVAGSTPYLYLQAALKKAGMGLNDVQIVSSGGTILTYQQLTAGTVEAAVLSPPFDAQAELQGFHQIQFLGDLLQFPYIGAGSSTGFLSAHHQEAVGFLKAMVDANRWLKSHPAETADLIVKYIGVPADVARKSTDAMLPQLYSDGFEASLDGIQQYIDIQSELTNTKINVTAQQVVDYGPLHEALAAH